MTANGCFLKRMGRLDSAFSVVSDPEVDLGGTSLFYDVNSERSTLSSHPIALAYTRLSVCEHAQSSGGCDGPFNGRITWGS